MIPYNNSAPVKKLADGKLNILIAEDDDVSEMLLRIAVASFAKKVFKTKTGAGAMDIQMPKMNGYEATRQIRLFNPDVIIIAQTAGVLPSSISSPKMTDKNLKNHSL